MTVWGRQLLSDGVRSRKKVFDELRQKLMEAPVLAYPNSEDLFILDTDAELLHHVGSKCNSLLTVELSQRFQTAVHIVSKPPAPRNGGSICRFFGQAGHADALHGRRYSSYKRVMSRQIQVRQPHTNKSGFAISAINKYTLGIRYPQG